jgi:hypothetical protein
MELSTEPRSIRIVGIRMKVGMQRSCASPEGITDLIDGYRSSDPKVGTGFVQRHVIAVR